MAAASTANQWIPPLRIACLPPQEPRIYHSSAGNPTPLRGPHRRFSPADMTAHKPGDPTTLNRLYGRSSGHKLRPAQQALIETLLPTIGVPADGEITSTLLFGDDRPLHLEIGFGSGEH